MVECGGPTAPEVVVGKIEVSDVTQIEIGSIVPVGRPGICGIRGTIQRRGIFLRLLAQVLSLGDRRRCKYPADDQQPGDMYATPVSLTDDLQLNWR